MVNRKLEDNCRIVTARKYERVGKKFDVTDYGVWK
jgi:hypothetical protein